MKIPANGILIPRESNIRKYTMISIQQNNLVKIKPKHEKMKNQMTVSPNCPAEGSY
jgi:hypothetical protein